MTCIVGLAHKGTVYMGADSAGVDSRYALGVRADRKIFRNGPFIMGFTDSFRMGQLLAFSLAPPKHHPDEDVLRFMVNDFVNAVRACLKAGGYSTLRENQEVGGTFLVGYAGRVFMICGDYQVRETVHGFDACGCGDLIALGSLYSTHGQPPQKRLDMALDAAHRLSAGVRPPFHFERLEARA